MIPFLSALMGGIGQGLGSMGAGLGSLFGIGAGAGGNIPPGMVLGPNGLMPAPTPQAMPQAAFLNTNQGAGVGFDPASGGKIGFQMQRPMQPPIPPQRPMQGADGMAAPAPAAPAEEEAKLPGLSRNPYEMMRSAGSQAQDEEEQKSEAMRQQIMQQGGPKTLAEYLLIRNQFGVGR